jgi:hypothetical protein
MLLKVKSKRIMRKTPNASCFFIEVPPSIPPLLSCPSPSHTYNKQCSTHNCKALKSRQNGGETCEQRVCRAGNTKSKGNVQCAKRTHKLDVSGTSDGGIIQGQRAVVNTIFQVLRNAFSPLAPDDNKKKW